MTFSFQNSDVDRLSLNQRVSLIEQRGGSGGGGSGLGVGMPDFDQYPDNAFKITSDGIIFKLSFANISQETKLTTFNGVDFRMCCFMPFRFGIPIGPFLILTRMQYTQSFNSLGNSAVPVVNFNKTIDEQDFLDTFVLGQNRYVNIALECRAKTSSDPRGGLPIQYLLLYFDKSSSGQIIRSTQGTPIFGQNTSATVLPCTSFGAAITYQENPPKEQLVEFYFNTLSKVVCGNFEKIAPNATVDTPQDLPNNFKPFYPKSWYQ